MRAFSVSVLAGLLASSSVLLVATSGSFAAGTAASAPKSVISARRITETQYRHAVADAFGEGIVINARFEPGKREDGLMEIGGSNLSITSGGFEQYFALARSIADQALDPKRRDEVVGCMPADAKTSDSACARAFIEKYGARLFRRPLTSADVAARVSVADKGAVQTGDFYEGLKLSLVSLLMAPEYLFRMETAEPDPENPGQLRLDAYSKAARLSYLAWDAGPDAELSAAAASGDLHTRAGVEKQLARLVASPRLRDGARAFFTDMLQLEHFDSLIKDGATYPKFSLALADSAREQTLRTLIDHLVTRGADYREIFTSDTTFLNRHLAAVYQVPYPAGADWKRYTFPTDAGRSGILTEVTFLSLFSHPAASSPTKRGVKVHEIFRCIPTPEPPADVDFSKVQALEHGTVRVRLLDHMTNPGCATCHRLSDPLGLALEHFDGLGQTRKLENGQLIDVSGEWNGKKFSGAQGVGKLLYEDPRTAQCLVRNVFSYGVGRTPSDAERAFITAQTEQFAKDGYRYPTLITRIGSSSEFFRVQSPPKDAAPPQRLAHSANLAAGDIR